MASNAVGTWLAASNTASDIASDNKNTRQCYHVNDSIDADFYCLKSKDESLKASVPVPIPIKKLLTFWI